MFFLNDMFFFYYYYYYLRHVNIHYIHLQIIIKLPLKLDSEIQGHVTTVVPVNILKSN